MIIYFQDLFSKLLFPPVKAKKNKKDILWKSIPRSTYVLAINRQKKKKINNKRFCEGKKSGNILIKKNTFELEKVENSVEISLHKCLGSETKTS